MQHTLNFRIERETKGAVRYYEVDENGNALDQTQYVVGSLYIRKTALKGAVPQELTVTIIARD